ncbi:tagaturonate reductase [Deminuibacter soli]|uniref:Tagaturonate reductase n=1 Tax=Deminuibacter soli TaxID=2291815 RepID=A0A3E1NL71_9BACT|nr:tagaturonate reductase [Deminuibacter soli]RFM28594.1 tagaturonate reductase [Deminuibacter soli]
MILSKANIPAIHPQAKLRVPAGNIFELPEKVIQFGTGVLLRGLPDYFIDKANSQGVFNGRIVVIKSTGGDANAFDEQDGLFTHCVKGIAAGQLVEETIVNAAISRVLSANDEWEAVLACAENPALDIIISNTTEVGITLVKEQINTGVPSSYPGKLLAFLYRRYQWCKGDAAGGLVIIPTELISDNGKKLLAILLELAAFDNLDAAFVQWLQQANDFCSSLVDRIVPGKLPAAAQAALEAALGYTDALTIMSECYSLWAIETSNEQTKAKLSFSQTDKGVVLAPDITKFKELKLRLLNGTHTYSCGLAIAAGFATVKEALANDTFCTYIRQLMLQEIAPAITGNVITAADAEAFALQVIDRFKNPHIEHQWKSITMQYTSKMVLRNVPLLQWYYEKQQGVPQHMALGFAAYLLLLRGDAGFTLNDDKAAVLQQKWQRNPALAALAQDVLSDVTLWGANLASLAGFADAVTQFMQQLQQQPALEVMAQLQ